MFSKINLFTLKIALMLTLIHTSFTSVATEKLPNSHAHHTGGSQAETVELIVYKSATCGCCQKWVDHINEQGIMSHSKEFADISPIKSKFGINTKYQSCHTSVSKNGYAFEGHIPAKFIKQFLKESHATDVIGLSVPGMPMGIPGMEVGDNFQPYSVLLLKSDGSHEVYVNVQSYEEQF